MNYEPDAPSTDYLLEIDNATNAKNHYQDCVDAIKNGYDNMPHEQVVQRAQDSAVEIFNICHVLTNELSNEDRLAIAKYFGMTKELSPKTSAKSILEVIVLLTDMAKKLAEMVTHDRNVMQNLAADEPEIYANVLARRRFELRKHVILGQYSANYLTNFLATDNEDYFEYFKWHKFVESDEILHTLRRRGHMFKDFDLHPLD
jgi:hypothetical protein